MDYLIPFHTSSYLFLLWINISPCRRDICSLFTFTYSICPMSDYNHKALKMSKDFLMTIHCLQKGWFFCTLFPWFWTSLLKIIFPLHWYIYILKLKIKIFPNSLNGRLLTAKCHVWDLIESALSKALTQTGDHPPHRAEDCAAIPHLPVQCSPSPPPSCSTQTSP